MHAFGMLLLAAATAGDGFGYDEADVGHKKWLRHHLVSTSHATGAPPYNAASLAGGGWHGRQQRAPVHRDQEPDLLPRPQRHADRLAERDRSQRRTDLPASATDRAGTLQLQPGLHLSPEDRQYPGRSTAVSLYPTLEVAPTTPATDAYLAHNAIPVQFTAEDFDQVVDGGNFVTKVIYLPDPKYQELAISGVETLVSTRLEPGVDPILEADKRGTILLIVRLGAIDLEMPNMPGVGRR